MLRHEEEEECDIREKFEKSNFLRELDLWTH
jgi:hypothetical protein